MATGLPWLLLVRKATAQQAPGEAVASAPAWADPQASHGLDLRLPAMVGQLHEGSGS